MRMFTNPRVNNKETNVYSYMVNKRHHCGTKKQFKCHSVEFYSDALKEAWTMSITCQYYNNGQLLSCLLPNQLFQIE